MFSDEEVQSLKKANETIYLLTLISPYVATIKIILIIVFGAVASMEFL